MIGKLKLRTLCEVQIDHEYFEREFDSQTLLSC
jgi:hypothetical protein